MWPGFESQTRRQMWVEFVVGFHPCSERFFSGYSSFLLSSKTNISKFQFDQDTVDEEPPCRCATANSHLLFILYYLYKQNCELTWPAWRLGPAPAHSGPVLPRLPRSRVRQPSNEKEKMKNQWDLHVHPSHWYSLGLFTYLLLYNKITERASEQTRGF